MLTNSIKSYLQLISLKKLFGQSSIYNSFRLKKTKKGNKTAFSMSLRIFESPFSITKSVSDNSKLTPLETREPLKQSNADLSRAKDTSDGIRAWHVSRIAQFFVVTSSASLLWKRLHSAAIPPVVVKTNSVNLACSTFNTRLTHWRFLFVVLPECLVCLNRSLHLGGKPSQRKPTPASLSYIQPLIQGGVGSAIQIFSCDVLQNWFDFKQFRLQIPQFIMALDDKSAPFVYHSVIHMVKMSPQTQTEGVSGTSQSYLSFTASRNSLSFKSKSLSLIGKTVSQLNAPFWVAIKSHSS